MEGSYSKNETKSPALRRKPMQRSWIFWSEVVSAASFVSSLQHSSSQSCAVQQGYTHLSLCLHLPKESRSNTGSESSHHI